MHMTRTCPMKDCNLQTTCCRKQRHACASVFARWCLFCDFLTKYIRNPKSKHMNQSLGRLCGLPNIDGSTWSDTTTYWRWLNKRRQASWFEPPLGHRRSRPVTFSKKARAGRNLSNISRIPQKQDPVRKLRELTHVRRVSSLLFGANCDPSWQGNPPTSTSSPLTSRYLRGGSFNSRHHTCSAVGLLNRVRRSANRT